MTFKIQLDYLREQGSNFYNAIGEAATAYDAALVSYESQEKLQ